MLNLKFLNRVAAGAVISLMAPVVAYAVPSGLILTGEIQSISVADPANPWSAQYHLRLSGCSRRWAQCAGRSAGGADFRDCARGAGRQS